MDIKKASSLLKFRKKSNIMKAKNNILKNFKEGTIRNRVPFFMIKEPMENLKDYYTSTEIILSRTLFLPLASSNCLSTASNFLGITKYLRIKIDAAAIPDPMPEYFR